jgi:protein-S-isoprenylcysteine O-methyltransferase Ste14
MTGERDQTPPSPNPGPTVQLPDHPNVIALPPLIYLAFIVIGAGLHYVWPIPILSGPAGKWLGRAFISLSIAIAMLTLREFRRWNTSFRTDRSPTSLIRSGPFGYTRNPFYLAASACYLGIALYVNSFWLLAMLLPALVVITKGVIEREERYLERKFGSEYLRYKQSVRRWL